MTDRPNYVMIVTDQQCADWLSCAGHPVLKTPNIDRLADRGVRFTQFHTASPACMPNRASIYTGRYPSVHGLKYNGCALSPDARTFVEMLRDSGYQTAAIGKLHLQPFMPNSNVPSLEEGNPLNPIKEAWKRDFSGLDNEGPEHYEQEDYYRIPTPYYGYDFVDMVLDHGDFAGGHYLQWLKRQDQNWRSYRDPDNQFAHDYSCFQAKRTTLPEELYPTRYIENRAVEWLIKRRRRDAPFFLFVSFPDPHHPFNPPGRYWSLYKPEQFSLKTKCSSFASPPPPLLFAHERLSSGKLPSNFHEAFAASDQHCREAMALTAGMITMIDDAVGSILDALEEQGLSENTTLIFTSDHGDYLGDGNLLLKGPWIRDSIHRVPFIWADPKERAGVETEILGSAVDIAPTILTHADAELFFGMQGRNLLADIEQGKGRESLLIELNELMPRMGFKHAARTRTIYRLDYRLTVYARENWGELYDSNTDPDHTRNLWDDERYATLKQDLLLDLTELLTLTMDESPKALGRP